MSIEAMKQALEALQRCEGRSKADEGDRHRAITSLRQAIDAQMLASKPPGLCMCGEPWRLESVHRKKSPCFDYIEREWVGLTDEEIKRAPHHMVDGAYHYSFKQGAEWAEAKLRSKNT
jgi:hypothetical protein